jgi:hypothetical protein
MISLWFRTVDYLPANVSAWDWLLFCLLRRPCVVDMGKHGIFRA